MRLDHFIVHIDGPEELKQISSQFKSAGFPFDSRYGKGTNGFHANYLWVGNEYFEIVWLKNQDGGGWQKEWVEKHHEGKRGIFCVFLEIDNVEKLQKELASRGVPSKINRTSFRVLMGLWKVTMPWKYLTLPALPGTNLELNFFQYETGAKERFRPRMKPNARDNGISGVPSATLSLPEWEKGIAFLKQVFPHLSVGADSAFIPLESGKLQFVPERGSAPRVQFEAHTCDPSLPKRQFSLKDTSVQVTPH